MAQIEVNESKLEALIEKLVSDAAAVAHGATVVLGDRLGLYRALADGGPQTIEVLAEKVGCHPRLLREWADAQVASGYCTFDPETGTYSLDAEQAACLATEGQPFSLTPTFQLVSTLHTDIPGMRRAFEGGEGFGWHQHHDDLFHAMSRSSEVDYSAYLTSEWIPSLDGVEEKLRTGAKVADIGCGYGGPTITLAQAYPASTFHGFDYHLDSIEVARKRAADAGVSERTTFEAAEAQAVTGSYDLVCTFDAFHDMGDPVGVASKIRELLAPGGTWMIAELNASGDVVESIDPVGRLLYSISSFVCVPNALSQADAGALGAAAGKAAIDEVLTEAGFAGSRQTAETDFNIILEVKK